MEKSTLLLDGRRISGRRYCTADAGHERAKDTRTDYFIRHAWLYRRDVEPRRVSERFCASSCAQLPRNRSRCQPVHHGPGVFPDWCNYGTVRIDLLDSGNTRIPSR